MSFLKRCLTFSLLLVALYGGWQWFVSPLVFTLSEHAPIALVNDDAVSPNQLTHGHNNAFCLKMEPLEPLDNQGQLRVLSWNIYKQKNDGWDSELLQLLARTELSLLQEVSLSPSFVNWLNQLDWFGQQASAFEVFDKSSGVFNLSQRLPEKVCAVFETEPWLQLPKSALFASYQLSNGDSLWVVNLHAVNFTLGTEEFEQQLAELEQALIEHQGPAIFAGDFNTWSETRQAKAKNVMRTLGLKEAQFTPDLRTTFAITGQPLDHIFYRGLQLKKAEVINTSASDHNALWVEFTLN
ncbi:endonuclease/exonuclease/phosphatase family protein [Vibrio sp. qd031]|uniref:endonuclease/exonuclease/phosphatase family protein n=1 Tax=Vibrio sp. qd031 TaxID=1603038 RepID=UPI000A1161F8|nr:endonuclease/exonuclease/phosphatase family protein [Vibrio sp. qd031]